jgi:hypothetical protein
MAHHVIHGDETNSVAVRAITDITGPAGGFASVASDPKPDMAASKDAVPGGARHRAWPHRAGPIASSGLQST